MPSRPNIVFICSDQHGARWTGFDGSPVVRTPHLDRIAKEGVVFDRAYCLSPICVPSRAGMMTGMYPSDCGSFCNSTVWDGRHRTWGSRLQGSGYRCVATGKLDLDDRFPMGFETINAKSGHWNHPDITSLFRRPSVTRLNYRRLVDGTPRDHRLEGDKLNVGKNFLSAVSENSEPWALYVGFNRPHPKFTGLREIFDSYLDGPVPLPTMPDYDQMHPVYHELSNFHGLSAEVDEEKIRRARAAYFATITELDEDVGEIWDLLSKRGLLANTIFVYTSDHGESLGEHGQWLKTSMWDESVRVPLIMAGAGIPAGRKSSVPVSHADLIATIVVAAEADAGGLRGTSLWDLMSCNENPPPFAYSECHAGGLSTGVFMIHKGPWKYTEFSYYPEGLLFNLDEDPRELRNRFSDPECAVVLEDMRCTLRSCVHPEAVTEAAFAAQKSRLDGLTEGKSVAEIAALLQSRLGIGQARVVAEGLVRNRR